MAVEVETLAAYVPDLLRRRLVEIPSGPLAIPPTRGALMLSDVSGFTALTERLAKQGPQGVEQLSSLLNTYFDRLITFVEAQGGDILKLAGDALIGFWPAADGADGLARAALRAAGCGLAIRRELGMSEVAPGVRLETKIGLGVGTIQGVSLGGVRNRWELLLDGPPFAQIGHAEHLAHAGEVIASPEVWGLLAGDCDGRPLGDGYFLVDQIREGRSAPPAGPAHPVSPDAATLLAFIPGAIRSRLAAGQDRWLSELRRVSVLFVWLNELKEAIAADLERAEAIFLAIQEEIYRHEGSLNKISIDDKGMSLLAAFGLPPLAHRDDPERALRVALALRERLAALGLTCGIGVATGRAYCGEIGSPSRREYTLIGDIVNLAARLMQATGGDGLLCEGETRRVGGERFEFETLPPVSLKGKAEPVAIFRPSRPAERRPTGGDRPLVGRLGELGRLGAALDRLRQGRGGVVAIEGEAGIGKSRLIGGWLPGARESGATVLVGDAQAIGQSSPYHAWRPIVAALLGLGKDQDHDPATVADRLRSALAGAPELLRMAPLLDDLVGAGLDAGATDAMDGQVRADNLHDLILALLRRRAAAAPLVVLIEDAHWLDGASWTLAALAARRAGPLLLVLSLRPPAEPWAASYEELRAAAEVEVIRLEVLGRDEALALARSRLEVDELPAPVERLILDRALGHPFFTEELALAARDSGVLRIDGRRAELAPGVDCDALPFPDSLEGVVTERIDRLPPAEQLALKVASVVGRLFALRLLRDIYPIAEDRDRLAEHLADLHRRDITSLELPEPDLAYIFKHIITREVAYGMILHAQRRALHREVALWHERALGDDPTREYALLAHHWSMAGDDARAIDYLEQAVEVALRGGAYQEAVGLLREALKRAAGLTEDEVPQARLARWEVRLGRAYLGLGRIGESRAAILASLARMGLPAPSGRLGLAARYPAAIARQAWHRFRGAKVAADPAAFIAGAESYEILSQLCYYAQQTGLGVFAAVNGLNLAERAGPSPVLARAYATMTIAASLVPWYSLAEAYVARAEAVVEQVDDPNARAWVAELTGVYALGVGQWSRARERFARALAMTYELGDWRHWEESLGEIARLDFIQGDFAASLRQFRRMGEVAEERGHEQAQVWSRHGSAKNLIALGRMDEAIEVLESSPALHQTGADSILGLGLLAFARLRLGEPAEARRLADETLRRIVLHGRPMVNFTMEGYSGAAEVYLTLWSADPGRADADLRARAARAVAALRAFASIYPIGTPRHALMKGRLEELRGRRGRALRLVESSLELSRAMAMPLLEILANRELARLGPAGEAERHAAEARRIEALLVRSTDDAAGGP